MKNRTNRLAEFGIACLLAGVPGFVISVGILTLFPIRLLGFVLFLAIGFTALILFIGGVSIAVAHLEPRWSQLHPIGSAVVRWLIVAGLMIIPTVILFGPCGGFHHMIGFGFPQMYMVLNGEDPDPNAPLQFRGYEVSLNPKGLLMNFILWTIVFGVILLLVHPWKRSSGTPPKSSDDGGENA